MKKKIVLLGILAIALVFGMIVLGAKAEELVAPDEKSAVVYFIGGKIYGSVWDGETPIGDFAKGPFTAKMAWKTTPGEHYFMANTFNWVVTKANLDANKTYVIRLVTIPNPIPFSKDFIAMAVVEPDAMDAWLKMGKTISFDDAWRAKFAKGKILEEAREHLQKAKDDKSKPVDLSGVNGR